MKHTVDYYARFEDEDPSEATYITTDEFNPKTINKWEEMLDFHGLTIDDREWVLFQTDIFLEEDNYHVIFIGRDRFNV